MIEGLLALYYLSSIQLEDPEVLYGINWEEKEAEELMAFLKLATKEIQRRHLVLKTPVNHVRITRNYRIYIGRQELKVRPMAKSVLLLFLKHPEGIILKDVNDYREELSLFYRKISRSDNPKEIERRIMRITDLFNNELNVNIARVNKALASMIDDACHYQITGEAGASKRIWLDRKWVTWE